MSKVTSEHRSPARQARDQQIADEAPLKPPTLTPDAAPAPVEEHLDRLAQNRAKPVAIAGVVENGVVRPVDPTVKLTEHARVIIVASASG